LEELDGDCEIPGVMLESHDQGFEFWGDEGQQDVAQQCKVLRGHGTAQTTGILAPLAGITLPMVRFSTDQGPRINCANLAASISSTPRLVMTWRVSIFSLAVFGSMAARMSLRES
jgi:hypothetical protein